MATGVNSFVLRALSFLRLRGETRTLMSSGDHLLMPHADGRLTRRTVLTRAVAGCLVALNRFALGTDETGARRPPGAGYFDIHVHLTQEWFGRERGPVTADVLLRWMDAHEIAQAAVLPLVSPEAFWYPISTEYVLRECREHADRLIPFCAIDPRTLATHLPEKR